MFSKHLFKKDFTLVIIGQIISLFGNAVLRLALPLYLLNQTGSASLFGIVTAISFIPMILLSPVGGIIADRVNKRNVMVILDFTTAGITLLYLLLLGKLDITVLTVAALILLYGIQGAYQPSVQASIPALVAPGELMPANSAVTLVNSLSGLIGPVIGGTVYSLYGIIPVLLVSAGCFFASAVMEIFIRIPFEKKAAAGSVLAIAKGDMADSLRFIRRQEPVIGKVALYIAAINLVFSALLTISLPVIITQKLSFDAQLGNRLYSYCEGAMAAGGILGGVLSGTLAKKLRIQNSGRLIFVCSFSLVPIGLTLMLHLSGAITYAVILVCCFLMMIASTTFSIEMMAYTQAITPPDLIGKIMALALGLCMCASPLGQAVYGVIVENLSERLYLVFFAAAFISCIIGICSGRSFRNLENLDSCGAAGSD